MSVVIYFYGSDDEAIIKIGKANDLKERHKTLETGQLSNVSLHLLAAVRGQASSETALNGRNGKGGLFDHLRANVNSKETYRAEPELVEYVNWLRQQPYTFHEDTGWSDLVPDFKDWMPKEGRRLPVRHGRDDLTLFSDTESNEPWSFLALPLPAFNDYYTPPSIVKAAATAMGGIDLDAASNKAANDIHQIPDYFHANRSALENRWYGRVWLNPPYGHNTEFFPMVARYLKTGDIAQICILSQMSAFITKVTHPLLRYKPSLLLFSPTPTFWGCNKKGEFTEASQCEKPDGSWLDSHFGTDLPHGILYIGDRKKEFASAFKYRGPIWSQMEDFL